MATTKRWMHQLSMAACEWFLMFLMFIDAGLAYFVTKFAQYCKLQIPCLFCLRLGFFSGNQEHGSYSNLFCRKHQSDISSLVSCGLHNKLANVREMCEDCFMSITIQAQSNLGSNRVMVSRMRREWHQRSYLNKNFVRVPSSTGVCSCCRRQWKPKLGAQRLTQPNAAGSGSSKVPVKPPLPRASGGRWFTRRDSLKRARDKLMGTMSQVGYTELKCSSDSESEAPFSDDECASSAAVSISAKRGSKDDSVVLRSTGSENKFKHRRRHSYSASDLTMHLNESTPSRVTSLTSSGSIGQRLGELNWAKLVTKTTPSPPPEPVSHSDQSNAVEFPFPASAPKSSVVSTPSMPHDTDTTLDQKALSTNEGEERDPLKAEKDKNPLLSTNSTQETDSSAQVRSGLSSMDGNHVPQVSASSDKNDSRESLDESSVSEIEGESAVDKVKQKVEHDKKCIRLLQSELEEERNATAIAANQAMTMITRLQEEKTSLQMDALQYLRMMEEQAEYDMEALVKAHDIIEEKEKEIEDLQGELDYYRSQFDDEQMMGYETMKTERESSGNGSIDANSSSDSRPTKVLEASDKHSDVHAPITELEDEKRYISQSLSELEKKFHQLSTHDKSEENENENENENDVDSSKRRVSVNGGEGDLATLENEISDLNERLEALEADRDFLEHVCNTVHNTGGLQFVQEIAHHLEDLRRILYDKKRVSID